MRAPDCSFHISGCSVGEREGGVKRRPATIVEIRTNAASLLEQEKRSLRLAGICQNRGKCDQEAYVQVRVERHIRPVLGKKLLEKETRFGGIVGQVMCGSEPVP